MEVGSKSITPGLIRAIVGISGIAIFATLAFPSIGHLIGGSSPENLYNCEKHTIKQCAFKGNHPSMIDCLFMNNSRAAVSPNDFLVWNYDAESILTDTSRVLSDALVPPGGTVHIEFHADKHAHESVLCSMDPYSPLITRATWSLIDNSGD